MSWLCLLCQRFLAVSCVSAGAVCVLSGAVSWLERSVSCLERCLGWSGLCLVWSDLCLVWSDLCLVWSDLCLVWIFAWSWKQTVGAMHRVENAIVLVASIQQTVRAQGTIERILPPKNEQFRSPRPEADTGRILALEKDRHFPKKSVTERATRGLLWLRIYQ